MLSKRLKELRLKFGITQEELAAIIGVERSSIGKYEGKENANNPSVDVLSKLANYFNVSTDYLLGRDTTPAIEEISRYMTAFPVGEQILLPIVGKVSAGNGAFAETDIIGYEPADAKYNVDEYFYLQVVGNSMAPQIQEGDLALVRKQSIAYTGDVCVVVINDEYGIIKKINHLQEAIILHSFNPYYPDRVFKGTELEQLRIVGKVIETKRRWW